MKRSPIPRLRFFIIPLLVFAAVFSLSADMTIVLRDGRVLSIPVNAGDILSISFADDGKASVSPAASPSFLPAGNLALWLDAAEPSTLFVDESGSGELTAPGGPVGLWKDKSGSGRHFSRPGSAGKPTLSPDGMGGAPGILFSPGKALAIQTDFPAPVSVFYVARTTGGAAYRVLAAVANNWLLGYWMGYINQAYFEGWVANVSKTADASAHVFSGIIRGKGKDSELWADGVLVAANQQGVSGPAGLGVNASPYTGEQSDCMVSEIIVYDRALEPEERKSVEAWLSAKWIRRF